MLEYWLYNACDSWCNKYHNGDEIKIVNEEITSLPVKTMTLYGNYVVRDGTSYIWKVKMNKFGYGDRTMGFMGFAEWCNPTVGIIRNDDKILREYKNSEVWAGDGYGYAFIGDSKHLRSKTHHGYQANVEFKAGKSFNKDGDVIFIHLDLEKYTLGYTVNDEYCGIAFENIEPAEYRLAIAFCWRQNETKLEFLRKYM